MDLYLLDYLAATKKSVIHKIHPLLKIFISIIFIAAALSVKNIAVLVSIYIFLNLAVVIAGLPWHRIFILSLYPILFLILFIFAMPSISLAGLLALLFKVISISMTMILLFATTTYPCVFGYLGKCLPSFLAAILFLTYRSIFIILSIFDDIKMGFYLRHGINYRRPLRMLENISKAFGHLVIHAIDESQMMYEMMRLRGFKDEIKHMEMH